MRPQYVLGARTVEFNGWHLQLLRSRHMYALCAYCTGLLLDDVRTNVLVTPDEVRTSWEFVSVGGRAVGLMDPNSNTL